MSLKTPLGKVKGLGSAGEGTHHWWHQRLTAVLLVPLTLWLMFGLLANVGEDYAGVTAWFSSPVNAVLMMIFIISLYYHAELGLQVVIEDYVHSKWLKLTSLILVKFIALFAGLASILAIIKVFLGL